MLAPGVMLLAECRGQGARRHATAWPPAALCINLACTHPFSQAARGGAAPRQHRHAGAHRRGRCAVHAGRDLLRCWLSRLLSCQPPGRGSTPCPLQEDAEVCAADLKRSKNEYDEPLSSLSSKLTTLYLSKAVHVLSGLALSALAPSILCALR